MASESDTQLADLVRRYAGRAYRYLYRLVGDAEMARELTQETFLRIAGRASRRPDNPGSVSAGYLFAVARNAAVSKIRHAATERRHLEAVPPEAAGRFVDRSRQADPARRVEQAELRAALERSLAALPEMQRTVFLLSEIEQLSYAEIAEAVDCPAGTVASRKHQAVRNLRAELRRQGFEL